MSKRIFFVTGTDTGVGKTVFAAVLTGVLREKGLRAAALKPLCSGGREDARILRAAGDNVLTLDEVNPWHFHTPLAPLLAARKENRRVKLPQITKQIRPLLGRFEILVVEGAGGLLSPLGEKFDSRDCLLALRATPILVCPNRLGAINQVLLVLDGLPKKAAKKLQIILMSPQRANAASRSNPRLLAEYIDPSHLHLFPWLPDPNRAKDSLLRRQFHEMVEALLHPD